MTVPKTTVMDEWGLPYEDGNSELGVEIIEDTITGTGRWSVKHRLIVKIKGVFYQTFYSVGATEYQEERPWQNEKDVKFTEVQAVPKVITIWEPVSAVIRP